MAGAAILIILHEILSMPVALLVDKPHNKWSFTVVGWNAANSDAAFSLAQSGPIFEKYSLKPSAISYGSSKILSPIFNSFTTVCLVLFA